ncbi:hypothetical protein L2729_10210 [Shewanella gelidimarina]|uniref:multiheme c-type cytochrome n=1 Tax=Shewanella gelidimarina TaxID=56813 RepID=UPI00200C6843|nr:hypothetical protein [Shewanella gelidimarina]MCL1058364.1 hypothetical protein [Shewanella gelidimarina]
MDVQPTILPTLSSRYDGGQYQTAELEVTIRVTDSEGAPITVSPIEAGWFKYLDVSFAWDAENAYHFLALEAEGNPGLVPNSDGELSARASHANNVSFNNAPNEMIIRSVPEKGEYTYKVSGVPDPTISTRASNGLIIPVGTENKTGIIAIETVIFIDPDTGKPLKGSEATGTVRSSVAFFNKNGLVEKGRRTIVTNETCAACHGDQGYAEHGDSRNDMEQQCAACHAPGSSEWDEAHLLNGIAPKDPLTDHLAWNVFVHAMHAQGREEQQTGGIIATDPNGKTVEIEQRRAFEYPARLSDCSQCHVEGTANLDAIEKGTAVITRKVYEKDAPRYATSPAAATCWSCHAGKPGEKNEALRSHMTSNGATFETKIIDGVNATINGSMILDVVLPREACSVCHTSDNINKVHNF